MKKLILMTALVAAAFVSCKKNSDDSGNEAIPCDNVAAFSVAVDANGKATFTDLSTGHVSNWAWNFGDNATSSEKNPKHSYTNGGSYNVTLTVNNSQATCSKVVSKKANVPLSTSFPVPTTFTQKVMIEEFTAAWCGYCPYGIEAILKAEEDHPGKIIPIAIHDNDPMSVGSTAGTLETFFGVTGIPASVVNRVPQGSSANVYPGNWNSVMNSQINATAKCGLAVDASKLTSTTLDLNINAGFNQALSGDYRLIVYIVESDVSNSSVAYDQHNYMAQVGGSDPDPNCSFYNQPASIHNFAHNHVLRKVCATAGIWGDPIPALNLVAGGRFVQTYSVSIPATWNTDNCEVVVAVEKYSTNNLQQQIMNSQIVKFGEIKGWD